MNDTLSIIKIFDVAYPFELIDVYSYKMDTWFEINLITKNLLEKLPSIPETGEQMINVSSGMRIKVSLVQVGIQIGSIRIENAVAGVVEEGDYEFVLGRTSLKSIFELGQSNKSTEGVAKISSNQKEDCEALSLELYPITNPVSLVYLEKTIKNLRVLFNVFLISSKLISIDSKWLIERTLFDDFGIPRELQLKLTWVDNGSIWLTLKSSSIDALKYLVSLFETGASAKLAGELAESRKANNDAEVKAATRDFVIDRVKAEENRLKIENINETYENWRDEKRKNLSFLNELINQIDDPEIKEVLIQRKNEAILDLINQQILPFVRNIPRPYEIPGGIFLLPPSNGDDDALSPGNESN